MCDKKLIECIWKYVFQYAYESYNKQRDEHTD